jgi:UDP-N-acetylmuramoylalanine-D-glutamate ligase
MDATHGGLTLALEYRQRGAEVTLVDCYRTGGEELKREAASAGICLENKAPADFFDIVVAPVHCPDRFLDGVRWGKKITTHRAVGELCAFDAKIIEITGTKGKTSTAHLVAGLLSAKGNRVLLLSSGGLVLYDGEKKKTIKEKVSIAPTSILEIARMGVEFDIGVFEVSLGGTGLADIGVITTIGDDYPIAQGTRRAFDGKVQMAQTVKRTLVIREDERSLWTPHVGKDIRVLTFGNGGDVDVEIGQGLRLGDRAEIKIVLKGGDYATVGLSGNFVVPAYLPAFSAAATVAVDLGFSLKEITESLAVFEGVPGRGEIRKEGALWVIRDRNPGVSANSVRFLIECLKGYYQLKRIAVVVEPVSKRVCEKLDLRALEKVIIDHRDCISDACLLGDSYDDMLHGDVFRVIGSIAEVGKDSEVVLWCTKEGFR